MVLVCLGEEEKDKCRLLRASTTVRHVIVFVVTSFGKRQTAEIAQIKSSSRK